MVSAFHHCADLTNVIRAVRVRVLSALRKVSRSSLALSKFELVVDHHNPIPSEAYALELQFHALFQAVCARQPYASSRSHYSMPGQARSRA